jgi:hypothetical protein
MVEMEMIAATFGVHRNQDEFIPSQGPGRIRPGPFPVHRRADRVAPPFTGGRPAGDARMTVGHDRWELYLWHGDDSSRSLCRSG